MSKINLLTALIITTLLSSCGFHTPYKNAALNATVISDKNNEFAKTLNKRLNQDAIKTLTVQIEAETQKQQTASYKSSGAENSYNLTLSVPIKVLNNNKELLLSQTLTANTHFTKIDSTQADRLQIQEGYQQLRSTLVKKLLRRLSKLNEN